MENNMNVKYCPECGCQNDINSDFCSECGYCFKNRIENISYVQPVQHKYTKPLIIITVLICVIGIAVGGYFFFKSDESNGGSSGKNIISQFITIVNFLIL